LKFERGVLVGKSFKLVGLAVPNAALEVRIAESATLGQCIAFGVVEGEHDLGDGRIGAFLHFDEWQLRASQTAFKLLDSSQREFATESSEICRTRKHLPRVVDDAIVNEKVVFARKRDSCLRHTGCRITLRKELCKHIRDLVKSVARDHLEVLCSFRRRRVLQPSIGVCVRKDGVLRFQQATRPVRATDTGVRCVKLHGDICIDALGLLVKVDVLRASVVGSC